MSFCCQCLRVSNTTPQFLTFERAEEGPAHVREVVFTILTRLQSVNGFQQGGGDLPKENLALKKKIPSTKIVSLNIKWASLLEIKKSLERSS